MKKYSYVMLVVIAAVGILCAGCGRKAEVQKNEEQPFAENPCTEEYSPVCGVDGITYANACIATEQKGVAIATQGECPPKSSLTDYERKYLMWLLRTRMDLKLSDERISHRYTEVFKCPGCYDLYYEWGASDARIVARIIVRDETIESAIDSTGYDYITGKEGTPVDFPELLEYERKSK